MKCLKNVPQTTSKQSTMNVDYRGLVFIFHEIHIEKINIVQRTERLGCWIQEAKIDTILSKTRKNADILIRPAQFSY